MLERDHTQQRGGDEREYKDILSISCFILKGYMCNPRKAGGKRVRWGKRLTKIESDYFID